MKTCEKPDIPGTRMALEQVSTKYNIYALAVISLIGGVLTIVGFIGLVGDRELLHNVPKSLILTSLGLITFSLFIPWLMVIYFCRHLLLSVKRLEVEVAALKKEDTEQVADCNPH